VAHPARKPQRPFLDDPPLEPPLDPGARARAYRQAKLRRHARIERDRAQRYAGLRFWVVLLVLLAASVFVMLTAWREIERLFGL
jgi:hypothetical protein